MTEQQRIFLGHASEDKPRVRKLYHRLKASGFLPWLDAVDLVPGQNWRIEIPNAIKTAGVFLACLSQQSVAKQGYVQREFRYALTAYAERPPGSIFLIPVRLDECDVPDLRLPELELNLRDLHWVDLFAEDGFDRLVKAIEHAFGEVPANPDEETPSKNQALAEELSHTEMKKYEADPGDATPEIEEVPWDFGEVEQPSSTSGPGPTPIDHAEASQTSSTPTSRQNRNPTIVAAWIGAAAVIFAGILTSPWLANLFIPSNQETKTTPGLIERKTHVIVRDEPHIITPETTVITPETSVIRPSGQEDADGPAEKFEPAAGPSRPPFVTFRYCDRDLCPEMVMLPTGTFLMGSPANEEGRNDDEGPQHKVTFNRPFAIGKYEVTFKEYDRFAEATDRERRCQRKIDCSHMVVNGRYFMQRSTHATPGGRYLVWL